MCSCNGSSLVGLEVKLETVGVVRIWYKTKMEELSRARYQP
jgi:hypothetical protein